MPDPTSPQPIASGSRHARKKTVENWDDDFDYGGFKAAASSSSSSKPKRSSTVTDENKQTPTSSLPGRASPTDSIISSWDDSPPPSSHPPKPTPHRSQSDHVGHAKSHSRSLYPGPPRHSPSHTAGLPSTSSASFSPRSGFSNAPTTAPSLEARSRSGSTSATARQKLIKRHPSTSFIPMSQPDRSDSSLSSTAHPNRSTPHLAHSASREMMPPPSLPTGLERRKSKGKQKAPRYDGVRVSSIPFSPSQEGMRDVDRKPSFWKRFSALPAASGRPEEDDSGHRRRRSSSVGNQTSPSKSKIRHPPVPPLPANLRSASAASTTSDVSVVSHLSGASASSYRSGPSAALSSILRRSTSSLSKRSDQSTRTPPSSYTPVLGNSPTTSSPRHRLPQREGAPPVLHTSSSFSRGFHLPSPAPGSPYNETAPPLQPLRPVIAHSASFNAALARESDIETETETEDGAEATPRRRREIRPVSALPAPRAVSRGWDAEGWSGFGETSQASSLRVDTRSDSRSSYHRSTASEMPAPASPRLSGFTSNTMRRLGSISKKHGRRLSGGFKFGTSSSTSSNETDRRRGSQPLETVAGSPSKPNRSPVRKEIPPLPQHMPDEIFRPDVRSGTVSAPNSHFQTFQARDNKAKTMGKADISPVMASSLSEDALSGNGKEKQKRRQSWADFVIPKDVLEKQKGLKEGIGAVKKFAGGVENLRSFMDTHAELYRQISATGTSTDQFEFARLEAEFEQWWEMATVLIEVGSTGATGATQPDIAAHTSPARSRRITMASDEAKHAAAALSKLDLGSGPQPQAGNRSASLPDPEFALSPPRVQAPDQWRASTGRQDLSKRQLEVLRTMLRTPAPTSRPGLVRGSSTLSASSSGGILVNPSGSRTPLDREGAGEVSGVTFPSPPESNYVVPSASFPSPLTASSLAQPRPGMKTRKSNKGGLAGLKEFLRSLKGSSSSASTSTAAATAPGRRAPPAPVRTDLTSPSPYAPPSRLTQSGTSPPISPTTPSTPGFEEVQYPTQRSSFSAIPGSASSSHHPTGTSIQGALPAAAPLKRQTSPQKQTTKRPNIRNLFRTSSGNWSELVRGSGSPIPGQGAIPPVPAIPPGRRSIDSSSEREDSGVSHAGAGGAGPGIPGMPSRGILRQPSQGLRSKTPTSASFNFGGGKGWKSPKRRSKVPDNETYQAYVTAAGNHEQGMISRAMSRESSKGSRAEHTPSGVGANGPETPEVDRTVRPARKSRILGLGMPTMPSSPTGLSGSHPSKSVPGSGNASPRRLLVAVSKSTATTSEHQKDIRSTSNTSGTSELSWRSGETGTSGASGVTATTTTTSFGAAGERDGLGEGGGEDDGDEDLIVALTPENLPVLLDFLRQCEGKLGEWKGRAQGLAMGGTA